jgi:hypothetical protein
MSRFVICETQCKGMGRVAAVPLKEKGCRLTGVEQFGESRL